MFRNWFEFYTLSIAPLFILTTYTPPPEENSFIPLHTLHKTKLFNMSFLGSVKFENQFVFLRTSLTKWEFSLGSYTCIVRREGITSLFLIHSFLLYLTLLSFHKLFFVLHWLCFPILHPVLCPKPFNNFSLSFRISLSISNNFLVHILLISLSISN